MFRSPSIVLSFYGFIYRYDNIANYHLPIAYDYIICRRNHFCKIIAEIAFFFYLISIIYQYFIFLKSDKNFKTTCDNIFKKKSLLNLDLFVYLVIMISKRNPHFFLPFFK